MRKSEDISVAHGWHSMEATGLKHAMNPDKLRLAQIGTPQTFQHSRSNQPIDNTFISILRKVTAGVTVLFKCIFSGPAQNYFNNKKFKFLQAADTRKIAAVFDMVVVAPNFFCIFYHFDELREKPVSTDRTIAIVEETARMMTCFARVSYTVAVLAPNPVAKAVAVTSMSACHVVTAALEYTSSTMM
ncbi:hypothetical protein FOQG_12835 [Fusarium oxysporum f. sp. raphani 54005]|uniref:Uncharacterized protein n=2 Tax=Fusarium oxysporum TaxID=5507 RepID=X0BWJ1_FUSOX|nr:hypothetical protein FOVG_15406 [Fusarium oxysporum f. sp. pisi HDV247]EXK82874.1 hypothetical protein FOQG_12835 [Fusarium oxysporum f. sp. raphani 54005]KAJ4028991.1 hypothetical protein NW758_013868 [Fusarium oxysporum]KAJ4072539.1 hypothetical protein NW761_014811 [Fusarium oxysporum]KAJ4120269.1 hypothetical protein NW769_000115 [Fusarium oxysporum]